MLNKYLRERIRRAYYLKKKSIYWIAKEEACCRQAMAKDLFDPIHYLSLFECCPDLDALRFSPAGLFAMVESGGGCHAIPPINAQHLLSRSSSDARDISANSQTSHVFDERLMFFHTFLVQHTAD